MNKQRLFILYMGLLFIVVLFLVRLVYLQIIKNQFFKEKSSGQLTKVITIQPHRGNILDRRGNKLAMSQEAYSIYATPHKITNKKRVAETLAPILRVSSHSLLKKIDKPYAFVWLKRRVLPSLNETIQSLKLSGISSIQEEKRYYPRGAFASDVLGFVGYDGGLAGLEYKFDHRLKGSQAKIVIEGDPSGFRLINSKKNIVGNPKGFKPGLKHVTPASFDGDHVYTTLDMFIQHSVEKHLAKQVQEMEASKAQAIVMDPQTGEVLAMVDYPYFQPSRFSQYPQETLKNSCIVDVYEPGSIFKIVTMAAALEESLVKPDTILTIPETMQLANRLIRESHPRNEEEKLRDDKPVSEIMVHSLNVGTTMLAMALGEEKFYKYVQNFGFGQRCGIQLPGESKGILRDLDRWSKVDIGMLSFGQGISVTPLQMANAFSAIANGGMLMSPHIIKYMSDYEGVSVSATRQNFVRRVVSRQTAQEVKTMLEETVQQGTGQLAKIPQYRIMGKTGTAQIAGQNGVGYLKGEYVSSFVGMFPYKKPKYVILVSIHSPKKYISGGVVSAPVFKKIALDIIHYYNIQPDQLSDV